MLGCSGEWGPLGIRVNCAGASAVPPGRVVIERCLFISNRAGVLIMAW